MFSKAPKDERKAARAEALERGRAKRDARDAERRQQKETAKAARAEAAASRDAATREMEARRGPLVAKFSPGFTAIRVYRDGTIESKMHGNGSIRGATARVDQAGNKTITKDTRQTYLTIEGPSVAISAKLTGSSGTEVRAARKFAATVTQLALQLSAADSPPPSPPPVQAAAAPVIADASIPDQISKLAALRDKGILTEDEFATKKAELLARM
jgi:hypothetical protein